MPRTPVPTKAELAILQVLWESGLRTVREIHNALKDQRGTGYSTTLKMIQVMTDKGLVRRDDSQRPQRYRAALPEEATQLQMVDDLIQRGFGGSALKLVLRAVSARRVSAEELADIRSLIDQAKRGAQ